MKIEDLDLFVHVVDSMSFTDAANKLDLPQSSVSRKIKQIEDSLKVRLFERTSRQIFLTKQGEQFYTHSKKIVDEFNLATENLTCFQKDLEGTITICMHPFMASLLSKEFFSFFLKTFPNMSIIYKSLNVNNFFDYNDLDLVIYIHPPKDHNVITRRIFTAHRRFYASPQYLAIHGTPLHPSELITHNCLKFDSKTEPAGDWSYTENGEIKTISVEGSFTSDSINLTCDLAIQDLGVCWIPQFIANEDVRDGKLVCLFEGKYSSEQPVYVMYNSRRHMQNKIKTFLDMLIQYMEQKYNVFNN